VGKTMSNYDLLGLDTLELITLGDEKSAANAWGLYDFTGPALNLGILGAAKHRKLVYLPKDLLEKLYGRFALANPKGTRIVAGSQYENYAPPDMTEEDKDRLCEEGKLFLSIPGGRAGHLRLRELLPELDDLVVQERLASDPALDLELMRRAYREGALPLEYGPRDRRWLPEWDAYVASYKKAHPANSGA
jgi:hypothetical protein